MFSGFPAWARLGAGAVAFLVCAALPLAVRAWRLRRWGLRVSVTVDPDAPSPKALAGYFAEVARRLDERPERMVVDIRAANAGGRRVALDFTPEGEMRACVEGRRDAVFSLRGRWIPEHPVPLVLWPPKPFARRRVRLYVDPVDANRFRVMSRVAMPVPAAVYLVCPALAAAGAAFLSTEAFCAAAGLAAGFAAAR